MPRQQPQPQPRLERHVVQDVDEEIFFLFVQLESLTTTTHLRRNIYTHATCVDCGPHYNHKVVTIQQAQNINTQLGMTGGCLWDAAMVLTKYLLHLPSPSLLPSYTRVLELGAGCGLCGMVCDCVLHVGEVVLTDQVPLLHVLAQNVAANFCTQTTVQELVWGDKTGRYPLLLPITQQEKDAYRSRLERLHPLTEFKAAHLQTFDHDEASLLVEEYYSRRWDFILASDCIFNESHLHDFIHTLRQAYAPGTKILICSELRDHTIWEQFLHLLMENFHGIARIHFDPLFQKERDNHDDDDDDDGNDEMENVLPQAVVLYEVSGPLKSVGKKVV